MSKFIIIYYPGEQHANTSPEEGAEGRAKFGAWLAGLGDAVVDPGTPLGKRKTVSSDGVSDGGGDNSFMGFSVVQPTAWMPPSPWPRTARSSTWAKLRSPK